MDTFTALSRLALLAFAAGGAIVLSPMVPQQPSSASNSGNSLTPPTPEQVKAGVDANKQPAIDAWNRYLAPTKAANAAVENNNSMSDWANVFKQGIDALTGNKKAPPTLSSTKTDTTGAKAGQLGTNNGGLGSNGGLGLGPSMTAEEWNARFHPQATK